MSTSHLHTPPAETFTPSREATVYLHTPFHPKAEIYAETKFKKVLRPKDGKVDDLMKQIDGILLRTGDVTEEMVLAAPNLRIISRNGTGVDNVPLPTCLSRGIAVTNVPGGNAFAVAELAITLMLTVLRRVVEVDKRIRGGERVPSIEALAPGLGGKKVGLVGMGDIAYELAKLLRAFGCEVLVHSPSSPDTRWTVEDTRYSVPISHTRMPSLRSLLEECDVLSLHCPLNANTRYMIGREELGWMKSTAVVINTARGGIIDERALEEALKERKIGGAGLDVFEKEPAYGGSLGGLRDLDNVVLLPHLEVNTVTIEIGVEVQTTSLLTDVSKLSTSWQVISMGKGRSTGSSRS
ncbi:phosphoglycerate dehydrogenase [Cryptococcus neoformans Tu401-1]|nr:phosphoglycerate dehydrogenase [Cryptococcus neoformans var. grubii Bt1]OWZ75558.1 phosphoglycerate dehydrogenase [Cryptococcus neoformans var. grubii Bt85]OXG15728.1 phosphoglycerate dehydrogenase [Cryptococcus neoformans var. grubii Tu401-1]OXG22069.1 phosphoglycerate dehydrogenase [Cryptococcus neoformans var. grubii Ze90-1]OXM78365.1 phosphoglycerate dehydrogenase [Cryptococcus neoformans var. grubii Bt63]